MKFIILYFLAAMTGLALLASSARAEEFIEEIYDDEASSPSSPSAAERDDSSSGEQRKWSYGFSLGGGSSGFSGNLQARYRLNKYVVPAIDVSYLSVHANEMTKRVRALEFPVFLYAANPTVFWPFVAAGPGLVDWEQGDKLGTFDRDNSLTAFYLYGALIKFSENFGIVAENKTTNYLMTTPAKKVVNRGLPGEDIILEEESITAFSFYFQLTI